MDFYHVLNRGVEKRKIFLDTRDYNRFVHDLYIFNQQGRVDANHRFNTPQNMDIGCPYFEEKDRLVKIHFFCLMPNHYHLLVSPLIEGGVSQFMKKVNMGYAKYFNERYDRSGALFQGKYKSIHVVEDAHFMYLPYYIHLNPLDLTTPTWRNGKISSVKNILTTLDGYKWSSHLDYTGHKNLPSITDRTFFLDYYKGAEGYTKSFHKYLESFDATDIQSLGSTTLEK